MNPPNRSGKFDIDSISDDIQLRSIIKAMAHSNPANLIETDSKLTIDKLKTGFSYIKESTSSNPDGLHHGHWKTLIKDDDAFEPYALMIMFAFKFGEPPYTWELPPDNSGKGLHWGTNQDQPNSTYPVSMHSNEYGMSNHLGP
jgi:hypothetical protein